MILPNITNPSVPEIVLGAEEVLRENGFSLNIGISQYDQDREETLAQQVVSGEVDGALILTGRIPDRILCLPSYEQRVVALSRRVLDPTVVNVTVDNFEAARQMTRHLLELGHRKIAHFAGPLDNPTFKARAQGYSNAMEEAGLPDEIRILSTSNKFNLEAGRYLMEKLLAEGCGSAVVAAMDEMAIGATQVIRAAGMDIPRDMSVSGIGDLPLSESLEPPLSTVRVPRREMGQRAAKHLIALLEGKQVELDDVLYPIPVFRRSTSRSTSSH